MAHRQDPEHFFRQLLRRYISCSFGGDQYAKNGSVWFALVLAVGVAFGLMADRTLNAQQTPPNTILLKNDITSSVARPFEKRVFNVLDPVGCKVWKESADIGNFVVRSQSIMATTPPGARFHSSTRSPRGLAHLLLRTA